MAMAPRFLSAEKTVVAAFIAMRDLRPFMVVKRRLDRWVSMTTEGLISTESLR